MATAKEAQCERLRKRMTDPRSVTTRIALQEYRRLGCKGGVSLKGLGGKSLAESLQEAILSYRDAIAAHPEIAGQFKESTEFVNYAAGQLAKFTMMGKVLSSSEEAWMADAITQINTSRYRIEGKTEKSSGWLSVVAVAAVIGGVWYFSRPSPPLSGMRRRRSR